MKFLQVIFVILGLSLGMSTASASTSVEKETVTIENSLTADHVADELKITSFKLIRTEKSFKCTINVSTTLDDGTTIEGTLVFDDIGFFRCAALKIADLFSGEF